MRRRTLSVTTDEATHNATMNFNSKKSKENYFLWFYVVSIFALLPLYYYSHVSAPIVSSRKHQQIIIVDGGSSGTRVIKYKKQQLATSTSIQSHQCELFDAVTIPETLKKFNLPISSWSSNDSTATEFWNFMSSINDESEVSSYITNNSSILSNRKFEQHSPIFVECTAGMRMLTKKEQEQARVEFTESSPHSTDNIQFECPIDGKIEALNAWISMNFEALCCSTTENYEITEKFEEFENTPHETMGIVEFGGSSAQIAFEIDSSLLDDAMRQNIQDIYEIECPIQSNDSKLKNSKLVFAQSLLGGGINHAFTNNGSMPLELTVNALSLLINSHTNFVPMGGGFKKWLNLTSGDYRRQGENILQQIGSQVISPSMLFARLEIDCCHGKEESKTCFHCRFMTKVMKYWGFDKSYPKILLPHGLNKHSWVHGSAVAKFNNINFHSFLDHVNS